MLTTLKNGRDKSGHSGQPYKHWVSRRPELLSRPDRTRDKLPPSAPSRKVDLSVDRERPMCPTEI